jgi:hypothetical protein
MTRMRSAVLLVVLLAGCSIGPRGETTTLALSPRGAQIELVTLNGELRGELLEMRGDGVVLLTGANQLMLVDYDAVRRATVENGPRGLTGTSMRSGRALERLRRVSRFPQGLSSEVEARLLSAYGQSSLVVVRQ